MLKSLTIKDFAIIDEIEVDFEEGLTVITGETGAGKSIIIDALGLVLGGRAYTEFIRSGADESSVEALFDISKTDKAKKAIEALDLSSKGDELLIRRTISRDGKNKVSINGKIATLSMLEEITQYLVDIYGQHEHHSLLKQENHLDILDDFGGLIPIRQNYRSQWDEYLNLRNQLEELAKREKERSVRLDYLDFVIKEIEKAHPVPGELENLISEKEILRNANLLMERTTISYERLYGGDNSLVGELKAIENFLSEAAGIDPQIAEAVKSLESVRFMIEDTAFALHGYAEKIESNPARLEEVEERIEVLTRICKKYGGSIESSLKFLDECRREREELTDSDRLIGVLRKKMEEKLKEAKKSAQELGEKRIKAAHDLSKKIEAELAQLGMKGSRFEVKFTKIEKEEGLSGSGAETAEFFISPNLGEELKPLIKTASGGELSRIMLAIKSVLHGAGEVPTLVFDEIDAGIGGASGEVVGRKMRKLAKTSQVLCVTHLPQIASFAHHHKAVSKVVKGPRTVTRLKKLSEDERINEVARMLAGSTMSESARKTAKEMMERGKKNDD